MLKLAESDSNVRKGEEPQTYLVQKVIGNDTYTVLAQSQVELEDEFSTLYYTAQKQSNLFLQPPFEPLALLNLVKTNNTLNQCVEAMEVNVDGTGYEFVPVTEGGKMDPVEKAAAESFFREPYPNVSFTSIRRKLRQEMESIGYGFLEVLRNVAGDLVGLRNVETHNVRMVKLDEPVMVTKTVQRDGKDVQLTFWDRERRFAQRVALKTLIYYREFGSSRVISRSTGEWATVAVPIPLEDQGTELLMFGVHPDDRSPYFLPRWVNQMPSVIGSRKAEEQNLEFLDSGGMPPAIIFVQGGTLAKDASDQLRMYLSGQNKNKNRAVVIEAQSSSGSLDSAGTVQVKVERFGAEKAQDAMFMNYDAATEEHVRTGFRLPPLFLGQPKDYNFASAQTSYMVAEAQVFQPERQAFDERINMTIIKGLGLKTLELKSMPINLQNPANQMEGLKEAKDMATRESFLDEVNKLSGFMLELASEPQPDSVTATYVDPATGQTVQQTAGGRTIPQAPQTAAAPAPNRGDSQKSHFQQGIPALAVPQNKDNIVPFAPNKQKTAMELIDLAQDYAAARGLVRKQDLSEERRLLVLDEVDALTSEDLTAFNSLVASYTFGSNSPDLVQIGSMI